jgi:hypothetical protein
VRLGKAQKRSWAWWGVVSFVLLTIGAYVIFDILDVDGSQIRWPAGDAVMTQQVDAERFFRADLSIPGSTDLISPSLSRNSSTAIGKISPATTILRIRRSWSLPRVNLYQDLARASSPTADPA